MGKPLQYKVMREMIIKIIDSHQSYVTCKQYCAKFNPIAPVISCCV